MNQTRLRLDQLLACVAVLILAATGGADEKAGTNAGLSQWAIIAMGGAETSGVADLLIAELSNQPDIRLVERERIDSVLREMNLSVSGLADQSKAIQLGKLLTADAIVLIEREARSPTMRVRFVESRTGIRLWDDLREFSLEPPAVQKLAADLHAAGMKLKVPAQKRRTVSIMGIAAEKQEVDLVNAARSLHAFLERDLQACDDVVVLERERLKHLVAERELTGIDLELWSTAVLIEGTVRRGSGAKQLFLGIKLSRPDGGVLSSFEVGSDESGLEPLRADLLSKVLVALNAAASKPRGGESSQFAIRADRLRNHGLYAEAMDAAYAALALAPTRENYRRVRDLHESQVRLWYRPPQWRPGVTALVLEDATLAHTADLRQLEIGVREGGKLFDMSIGRLLVDPFIPHVPIDSSESAEVQAQRSALDEIRLAKYQLLKEACAGNSEDLLNVLIPRLHLAAYFAKDEADYVASVLALQGEIDRALERVEPNSKWRSLFIGENARALRQALFLQTWHATNLVAYGDWTVSPDRQYTRQRGWRPDVVRPVIAALRDHPALGIRLAVADQEVHLGGAEGKVAARRIFCLLRDEHWDMPGAPTAFVQRYARVLQQSGELAELVEPIIASAEKSKDMSQIYGWPGGFADVIGEAEEQVRSQWSERLVRLLQADITAKSSDDDRLRARSLYDRLKSSLAKTSPGSLEVSAKPEGLWKNFNVSVFHAEAPGIDQCLLADGPGSQPQIRLLGSRTPDEKGEQPTLTIPLDEQWRDRLQVEASPQELFVIQRNPDQIVAISPGSTRRVALLPESNQQLRGRELLRWLDGKLYLLYTRGFESIDPATGEFATLASSLSAAPRNQLDGNASFAFGSAFADEQHKSLWLSVASRDRGGIWKYSPADDSLEWVVQGSTRICNWDEGGLVVTSFRTEGLWHLLDPGSGGLKSFSGYRHAANRNDDQLRGSCIKVGPYIVGATGLIVTQDGRKSQFPLVEYWDLLYPHDGGFIAVVLKHDHCTVWQFEQQRYPEVP